MQSRPWKLRPMHIALLIASALYLIAGTASAARARVDGVRSAEACTWRGDTEIGLLLCRFERSAGAPGHPAVDALRELGPLAEEMKARERERSDALTLRLPIFHF